MKSRRYSVTVYLVNMAYGGPEDGGWWYDTGHPSQDHENLLKRFHNRKQAAKYAAKLREILREENAKRPDYTCGVFEPHICIGEPRPFITANVIR